MVKDRTGLTFPHEGGDGLVEHGFGDEGVVGHGVVLHGLERRELHDAADDVLRKGQIQVAHDALHLPARVLRRGGGGSERVSMETHRKTFREHALPLSCPRKTGRVCYSSLSPASSPSHGRTRTPRPLQKNQHCSTIDSHRLTQRSSERYVEKHRWVLVSLG